jgi:hypothetical protein
MFVGDHEPPSGDSPSRLARVAPPLTMSLQQHRLDVMASESELLRLVECVKRPAHGNWVGGHARQASAGPRRPRRVFCFILYVDTSALLKLLVREAESAAIERELLTWRELATSVIAEVELPRAVGRAREERADAVIDGSLVLQGAPDHLKFRPGE